MTPFICGLLIGAVLGGCFAVLLLGLCACAGRSDGNTTWKTW